ncbi:hypothetical protein, partial [Neisseria gonorrhoeae]|uniref:hypothetical protein n=1 Tax=Neisseria gonorrhoeae TaxID=485 RepID=UPI001C5672DA
GKIITHPGIRYRRQFAHTCRNGNLIRLTLVWRINKNQDKAAGRRQYEWYGTDPPGASSL